MNIIEINQKDELFPEALRIIQNTPKKIYCIGNIKLLKNKKKMVIHIRNCIHSTQS